MPPPPGFTAGDLTAAFNDLPAWGKAAVGAGIGLVLYIPYKLYTSTPRKSPYKEDFEEGIVYLYQFPRTKCTPNMSPFCLKLETWLRMAEIPYEIVNIPMSVRSKEGTLPFIELNGQEYCDSSLIIRDLMQILNKTAMEEHLSEEQRAVSRAFEKLTELSLHKSHHAFRKENTKEMLMALPDDVFGIFQPILVWIMKNTMASTYASQISFSGIGKHDRSELLHIGSDDLKAISAYLGSKHYFTGFKPTRIDATIFGLLANIIYAPYDSLHRCVMTDQCGNLVEYVDRIKTRFWPDWKDCTIKFSTDSNWKKKPHSPKDSPKVSISPNKH